MRNTIIASYLIILISTSQIFIKRDSLTIYFINKEILTPYKLTDYYFDKYYLENSDSITIIDRDIINIFESRIENINYLGHDCFPDVRQKIVIRQENNEDIIIYSDGGAAMQKNGKSLVYDSTFQTLIDVTIKEYSSQKVKGK